MSVYSACSAKVYPTSFTGHKSSEQIVTVLKCVNDIVCHKSYYKHTNYNQYRHNNYHESKNFCKSLIEIFECFMPCTNSKKN